MPDTTFTVESESNIASSCWQQMWGKYIVLAVICNQNLYPLYNKYFAVWFIYWCKNRLTF